MKSLAALPLALTVLSAAAFPVSAESKAITVGGRFDIPPYQYLDSNGKPSGFDVDYMEAVADRSEERRVGKD